MYPMPSRQNINGNAIVCRRDARSPDSIRSRKRVGLIPDHKVHSNSARRMFYNRPQITGEIVREQSPDLLELESKSHPILPPLQISSQPLGKLTSETCGLKCPDEIRY